MSADTLYFVELYGKLFAASAPIAVMAIFIAMTPGYQPKERWRMAFAATSVAFGILLLCAFFGNHLLEFMGIEMDAFRIAGGMVLGLVGLDMIRTDMDAKDETEGEARKNIIVTPLAFPIISGPGAISSLMITKSEAVNATQSLYTYVAVIAIIATFYILFYITSYFSKWLTPACISIATKLFGLIVVALSTQFIAAGILGFLRA